MIVDHLDNLPVINPAARAYAANRVIGLSAELAANKRLRRRLKRRYFALQLTQAFCVFRLFLLKRYLSPPVNLTALGLAFATIALLVSRV